MEKWGILWNILKLKKARKSLIYTLLEVFGKPAGGESGIRTLDTLLGYTHFPGVLLRPLGQLSSFVEAANVMPFGLFSNSGSP